MTLAHAFAQAAASCVGALVCDMCGFALKCNSADAERYLRDGWPKCCGCTMTLDRTGGASKAVQA